MSQANQKCSKSLIERIYDEMFRIIEETKKFKEVEISSLNSLFNLLNAYVIEKHQYFIR